ncbi:MAG: hypothetical protein ACRD1I_02135 [Terriglobia bacterium]
MMKQTRLLALGLALGLIAWFVPFNSSSTYATTLTELAQQQGAQQPGAAGAPSGAQQQEQQQQEEQQAQQRQIDQQAQPQQSQQQQILLTGKVTRQNGHYMFLSSDTHTALRVSNPGKVKKYDGEMVKVEGTVSPKSHKIHVSKVTPVTS